MIKSTYMCTHGNLQGLFLDSRSFTVQCVLHVYRMSDSHSQNQDVHLHCMLTLCTSTFSCSFSLSVQVFKGSYDGQPVAVKVFRKKYPKDVLLNRYKDLREELTIMSQLDYPRVVSLIGVCLKPLCMVLQLAPLGSLRDHLGLCPRGMKCSIAHRLLYQVRLYYCMI